MANAMSAANTPTSSTPDGAEDLNAALVCFDPQHRDAPCPICGGLGWVRYDVSVDHPRFGKLYRCPNFPIEADEARHERLRRLSNLEAFSEKTFESFATSVSGYSDQEQQSLEIAYNGALNYARSPRGWLLLVGPFGCGKTHLAASVGHYRLAHGDSVIFLTTPDLLDHLRSAFSPRAESTYDELFERVRTTDLLILDDLGVENPSEWAKEKLFQLLNYRYSHNLSTVITTNADLDALDGRIRSRLLDVQVIRRINVQAPDYRSQVQNQNEQLLSRLPLYRDMTFDVFDVRTKATQEEQHNLTQAARGAADFARNPQGWLLFLGTYGSGKTHLAAAIANYRQQQGEKVMFITVPDLMDYLRTTFNPGAVRNFDDLFDDVRNVRLLVLDDLNTEHAKSWAKEKLFQLLDYRYVARLPTIITTAQQIDHMDERILSRLLDTRICRNIALTAASYTLRMRRP